VPYIILTVMTAGIFVLIHWLYDCEGICMSATQHYIYVFFAVRVLSEHVVQKIHASVCLPLKLHNSFE
jgi:hypothetical protein